MLKTARTELDKIKDAIINGTYGNNLIKLDNLFIDYMKTQPLTDWTHKKKHIYDLYIGNSDLSNITKEPTPSIVKKRDSFNKTKIGYKPVGEIIERDILFIISKMEKEHNLSPRTQKIILEVLNPVFDYAIRNRYLTDSPTTHITIKIPSQKKIVTNATELFKRVYVGIIEYYHDEPFYKALFLFAFTGRRKSEILNLKWENIDFTNNYYWIEDTKNGDKQSFKLSPMLKVTLLELLDDRAGLVFKSPITGKKMVNLDRQIKQLRKHTKIDNLTLHYMRNILVSALAEQQTEAITLSGLLGHKDINTINKYLSNSTMKSSIKGLETIDKILDAEIIE
jgi:integrase